MRSVNPAQFRAKAREFRSDPGQWRRVRRESAFVGLCVPKSSGVCILPSARARPGTKLRMATHGTWPVNGTATEWGRVPAGLQFSRAAHTSPYRLSVVPDERMNQFADSESKRQNPNGARTRRRTAPRRFAGLPTFGRCPNLRPLSAGIDPPRWRRDVLRTAPTFGLTRKSLRKRIQVEYSAGGESG